MTDEQISGAPMTEAFEPERPIGIVGAGDLGLAVAKRLAEAHVRVLVCDWDASRFAAVPRIRPWLDVAANLFDLAVECQTVVACLPTTEDLATTIFGSEDRPGLRMRFAPGGLLIDMTALARPRDVLKVQGFLGTRGIGLVDCALAGSPAQLAAGDATLLLGGFPDFLERAEPLLAHLGRVLRTGPLGTGHTAAALLAGMGAARTAAEAEAALIAGRTGVRGDALAALPALAAHGGFDAAQLENLHQIAAQNGLVTPLLQGVRTTIAAEAAARAPRAG